MRCGDSTAPDPIATVTVTPGATTLLLGPGGGQSAQFSAAAVTSGGDARASARFAWTSSRPGIATVSATGAVTAVQEGTTTISATVGTVAGTALVTVAPVPAASIVASRDSLALTADPMASESQQLQAEVRDSTGAPLAGRPVVWSSTAPSVASVSLSGLVTAVGRGVARAVVSTLDGRSDSVVVTVTQVDTLPDDVDQAITGVSWTQAVQSPLADMPMIRGGRAAALNVLMSATRPVAAPTQLVLRIFDAVGTLLRADTAVATIANASAATPAAPSAQFLVAAQSMRPDHRWEVVRDPNARLVDSDSTNDRYPRAGPAAIDLIDVPTLRIRFVPIVLTAHGNVTGNVTPANLTEYMRVARAVLPHGALDVTIGEALPSARSFGTPPSGGAAGFWTSLLGDIDVARIADPEYADAHWIGVVMPPAGFNFTSFGGYGYIPSDGASFGPATRTSAVVSAGWFTREAQTRELVAHELGHNLGRFHAPCGNPAGPDASFPNAGGTVGEYAHDVYSWILGLSSRAAPVSPFTGDLMGYCTPPWISYYSYVGMIHFRGWAPATAPVALRAPGTAPTRRVRSLVVRGTARAGAITLEPALEVPVTAAGVDAGDHLLEGLDAAGSVLFRRRFSLTVLDHDDTTRAFAVAVPVGGAEMAALASVVVRGPSGEARRLWSGVPR